MDFIHLVGAHDEQGEEEGEKEKKDLDIGFFHSQDATWNTDLTHPSYVSSFVNDIKDPKDGGRKGEN